MKQGIATMDPLIVYQWRSRRGDDEVGRVHQCFCVGPHPGEKLCPCQKRKLLGEPAYRNLAKPRVRVKAISAPF